MICSLEIQAPVEQETNKQTNVVEEHATPAEAIRLCLGDTELHCGAVDEFSEVSKAEKACCLGIVCDRSQNF